MISYCDGVYRSVQKSSNKISAAATDSQKKDYAFESFGKVCISEIYFTMNTQDMQTNPRVVLRRLKVFPNLESSTFSFLLCMPQQSLLSSRHSVAPSSVQR